MEGPRTDVKETSTERHFTSGRDLEAFWLHLCGPEIDGRQRYKGRSVGIQIRSDDTEPGISDYAGVACICRPQVSRPAGFHRQPLVEPCVNFSAHTAPIRQTCRSCRSASERRGSSRPVQVVAENDWCGFCVP